MAVVSCPVCESDVTTFPSKPRVYCSSRCYGESVKGIRRSLGTEFKKGERPSPETEFKKGQIAHNKGLGDRPCKTCGTIFGGRGRGKIYCSKDCMFKNEEWLSDQRTAKLGKPSSRKGITVSEEIRRKASATKQGISLDEWCGYTTTERRRAMSTAQYKEWRSTVFKRDNYACRECSDNSSYLHADHNMPWAQNKDLRYEVANGITLCFRCHYKKTFGYFNEEASIRWGIPSKYRKVVS